MGGYFFQAFIFKQQTDIEAIEKEAEKLRKERS